MVACNHQRLITSSCKLGRIDPGNVCVCVCVCGACTVCVYVQCLCVCVECVWVLWETLQSLKITIVNIHHYSVRPLNSQPFWSTKSLNTVAFHNWFELFLETEHHVHIQAWVTELNCKWSQSGSAHDRKMPVVCLDSSAVLTRISPSEKGMKWSLSWQKPRGPRFEGGISSSLKGTHNAGLASAIPS